MSHSNAVAYQQFVNLYVEANRNTKKREVLTIEAQEIWKVEIRKSLKEPPDQAVLNLHMNHLKERIKERKEKLHIKTWFQRQPVLAPASSSQSKQVGGEAKDYGEEESLAVDDWDIDNEKTNLEAGEETDRRAESEGANDGGEEVIDEDERAIAEDEADINKNVKFPPPKEKEKPVQKKLTESISDMNKQLVDLIDTSKLSILDDPTREAVKNNIANVRKERYKAEAKLKRTKQNTIHQNKYKNKHKAAIKEAIKLYPQIAPIFKGITRDAPGRPSIECDQPTLLSEILKIAEIGSACSDRRRDNTIRSVRTLDQLKAALDDMGFKVSRSGLYLKLLPRDSTSIDGKRHTKTVPVKLIRASNNLRKGHPDRAFARETCRSVDKIAETLGPEACVFLSQDDKAQVNIGITAAKKQAPMLMSLSHKVRLPDHDFVKGSKHKLTPSVIAKCEIDPETGVTYSGLTHISIRSSKHNNSSALTHIDDLSDMVENNIEMFESDDNDYKPVWIKSVDGGPDENPRFEKNILGACHVKQKFNLDAILEVTNAPGLSAYNRVERKMHPLSLAMAGVILPHDTFGTHLDGQGRTVDIDLEKQNFEAAGQVLAEVFGNITVDGYDVNARYVGEPPVTQLFSDPGGKYRNRHVFESQYFTVVLGCDDTNCCPVKRTCVDSFFPGRRLPALIPIIKTEMGPVAMKVSPTMHKMKLEFLDMFGRIIMEKKLIPPGM